MTYKFIKVESLWYIDIPEYIEAGGTFEDCQMVLGADTLLDILSKDEQCVELIIEKEEFSNYDYVLKKQENDSEGSWYEISGKELIPFRLWICSVTLFVLGEFPKIIYIKKI